MDAIVGFLQAAGVFVAGLAARVGIVLLAAVVIILVPALAVAAGARGWGLLRRWLTGLRDAGGFLFKRNAWYAPGHTWLAPDGGAALRIGIDDLAQHLIPWAVKVELPEAGARLAAGAPAASISCGAREIRIAAPVDGTVVAVNPAVVADPSLVKRENYGRGWLFAVKPADGRYLALRSGEPARHWLRAERYRLSRFFEEELGIATADGGDWIAPPPSLLQEGQWKKLEQSFLRLG